MRSLLIALAVLSIAVIPANAFAEKSTEAPGEFSPPPPLGASLPLTNPQIAEEMPHTELGREEVVDLDEGVFGPALEAALGPFNELAGDKFVSKFAAIVPAGAETEAPLIGPPAQHSQPALLESTVPLRTEGEPVDLTLEEAPSGEVEPKEPLVEVEIPHELGEPLRFPETGIQIGFPEAPPGRSPSLGESAAIYPNVSEDSDLMIVPTPTGVETMTTLRSAAAPRSETFSLSLPPNAKAEESEGGAVVTNAGETLLRVLPPTAFDANGDAVPTSLAVSGHSITVTAHPEPTVAWPIEVDPIYEAYSWWTGNMAGSTDWQARIVNAPEGEMGAFFSTEPEYNRAYWWVYARQEPSYYQWAQAQVYHRVPRLGEEAAEPTSYITSLAVTTASMATSPGTSSPYDTIFVWDPSKNDWAGAAPNQAVWGYPGNAANWSGSVTMTTGEDHAAKEAIGSDLAVNEAGAWASGTRQAKMGAVTVETTDTDNPQVQNPGTVHTWADQTPTEPLSVTVKDTGLGAKAATFSVPNQPPAKVTNPCAGTTAQPCPESWHATLATSQYSTASLPEGEVRIPVMGEDVLGHQSTTAYVEVGVDHTRPVLGELSGTVTEQAKVGKSQNSYSLKFGASDGTEASAEPLASIGSSGVGKLAGPRGVATDGKGHVWVVDRPQNKVLEFDEAGEYLSQFGSTGSGNGQFNAPWGITVTSEGNLWVTDTGNYRVEEFNEHGEFLQTFGTKDTGAEVGGATEFVEPLGIAAAPGGKIWVADRGRRAVSEFRESVTEPSQRWVRGEGMSFDQPFGVAVDSTGRVLVTDTSSKNAVYRFVPGSGKAELLAGGTGSGNGQFNAPIGIAVAASGNIFVADRGNHRIQEFLPTGSFLRKFGGTSEPGEVDEAEGLAVGLGNKLFLGNVSESNSRISVWKNADLDVQSGVTKTQVKVDGVVRDEFTPSCAGTADCSVGSHEWTLNAREFSDGPHTVEVVAIDGVNLTSSRTLHVELFPDRTPPSITLSGSATEQATVGNTLPQYRLRLSAADPNAGEGPATYSSAFGSPGSSNGQFRDPSGIAVDRTGNLWVVDEGNNRLEEFSEGGGYLASIGSTGSGDGQLNRPTALAIDSKGNLWVTDSGNARVEEFSANGEYLRQFGSPGTGNGQFAPGGPEGIAIDPEGDLWVADTYGGRIEKFSAAGEFKAAVGSKGTGAGQLYEPTGIAIAPSGNAWVADWHSDKIVEFSEGGGFIREFGSEGNGNGQFVHPWGVGYDGQGDLYVSDQGNARVQELRGGGEYLAQFGSRGSGAGQFKVPAGTAIASNGHVWVVDSGTPRVPVQPTSRSGVIAAYSFDEGEGTVAHDFSGHGHDAEIKGAQWTSGKYGKALEFNAAEGDELTVPDSEDLRLHDFTLEAWVEPAESREEAPVIAKTDPEGYGYALYAGVEGAAGHPQGFNTYHESVEGYVYSGQELPTHKWSHIAVTSDGKHLRLYINGALVDEREASEIEAGEGPLQIGGDEPFAHGGYFDGKIDEVRVYGRALSTEEIREDKKTGIQTPPARGPVAAYSFDEGEGTVAHDFSGHGHDAEIKGAQWTSGKYGKALEFNAAEGDELTVPDSEDLRLHDFTLEAWVEPAESREEAPVIAKTDPEGYGYALYAGVEGAAGHPQGFNTYHEWVEGYVYSGQELPTHKWSHVAVTSDGKHLRLYINGALVDEREASEIEAGEGPLQIGGDEPFAHGGYFDGKIDEVRVYGRALSGEELMEDVEEPVSGPHDVVQKWLPSALSQSGVASSSLKVDGKVVDSYNPGCTTGTCTLSREWVLKASTYEPGQHTAEVVVTDASGLSSSKSIPFDIARDETAPTLKDSGELAEAPEGWVEPRSYSFTATSADSGGYGVKKLTLKIDNSVVAETLPNLCEAGGCSKAQVFTVDASSYAGGEHQVEVIAVDNAGNSQACTWTMNVDPHGAVPAEEATATLEAMEGTIPPEEEVKPVAATGEVLERQEIQAGDNPHFAENAESKIVSTGVTTVTEINPSSETITIEGTMGALTVEPPTNIGAPEVTEGSAAVLPSSESGTDTVVRPEYDGAVMFTAIREESATEDFGWHISLGSGQTLSQVDEQHVAIDNRAGEESWLLSAEPAHDATGKSVPTTLEVSGTSDVILHVHHKGGGFVYPVGAGEAWETGYASVTVYTDQPEEPVAEEEEAAGNPTVAEEQAERRRTHEVDMNDPLSANELGEIETLSVMRTNPPTQKQARHIVHHAAHGASGWHPPIGSSHEREFEVHADAHYEGNKEIWEDDMDETTFARNVNGAGFDGSEDKCKPHVAWWENPYFQNSVRGCGHWAPHGEVFVHRGSGEHLMFVFHFVLSIGGCELPALCMQGWALQDWVFPNGYQEQHLLEWEDYEKVWQ